MSYDFAVRINVIEKDKEFEEQCIRPELLYVLEGTAEAVSGEDTWHLGPHDIVLLMPGESCRVTVLEPLSAVWLSLNFHFLYLHLRDNIWRLQCNSALPHSTQQEKSYRDLEKGIEDLVIEYAENGNMESARYLMLSSSLYVILEENFLQNQTAGRRQFPKTGFEKNAMSGKDQLTDQILDHIYLHYAEHISLSDIASKAYTSVSTLSRHFYSSMGISYVDYLKRFRLDQAREAIKDSDKSLTQIAMENGFQNSSSFSTSFREAFGESPAQFREKNKAAAKDRLQRQEMEGLKKIRKQIKEQQDGSIFRKEESQMLIDVASGVRDSAVSPEDQRLGTEDLYDDHLEILNIGPAAQMLGGTLEKQILELQERFHFPYYRIWDIFTPDLIMVQRKTGRINYSRLDQVLDFFVSHHMRLFLDLGRMTELTRVNEKSYIGGSQEEHFKSASEWRTYLMRFLEHIVDRYGTETTGSWIYEFTFFLNKHPYYEGANYHAKDAWETAWRCVRQIIPTARIAGPGLIAGPNAEVLEALIQDFLSSSCRPDLFTAMHFPYQGEMQLDADLKKMVVDDFMERQIAIIKDALAKNDYHGPYCITDWGCSISERNYIQDSCYRAAFFVRQYLRNRKDAQGFGIFYASDLISNYADSPGLLSGSAGILSREGLRKPVYFAVGFLKKLQGRVIAAGDHYIVVVSGHNCYQILCFHCVRLGPRYYLTEENQSKPENMAQFFDQYRRLDLSFQLNHVHSGNYVVRQHVLNTEHGDLLQNWISMGETQPTREETRYLGEITIPSLERTTLSADSEICLHVNLQPNEVRLIEITGTETH